MKITLYKNISELNKLNKTLFYIDTLTGTLRNSTSILNPSIEIDFDKMQLKITSQPVYDDNKDIVYNASDEISYSYDIDLLEANYLYIDEFKRYYYINDKIFVSNKIMRLNASIDVLMSFKEAILLQKGLIFRNEFDFDITIKDDIISFTYDKATSYFELFLGGDTTINSNVNYNDNNITISVINNQRDVVSYQNKPTPPSTCLSSPYYWNGGIVAYSNTYSADIETLNALTKWIINNNALSSYVVKMTAFPFHLKEYGGIKLLYLGDTKLEASGQLPEVVVHDLKCPQGDFYTICSQIFSVGIDSFFGVNSFLDREPYATYELYIPYVGYVPVDSDKIINKVIKIVYALDYKSGNAQVYAIANDKVIYTTSCQMGVDIPVNSTNALQVQNNNFSNAMGLSLGLIGGVVGMATGNPLAVTGGVLSVSKSIASFVNNANTNYNTASGTYGTTNGGLFGKSTAHIRITRLKPRDYGTSEFNHLYGRPLNKVKNLNELTGYTKVGEINLENFNCSSIELTMIESELKKGVIL